MLYLTAGVVVWKYVSVQVPRNSSFMTAEQYLKSEERASVRHEYIDGQVFAMSGATRRHNIITLNISAMIRSHVKVTHCRVYMEAVKVRIDAVNCFYYPDVMVSCDKYDGKSVYTENPVLVFEVLSPSTTAVDHREKCTNYRKIKTLFEYVIVHQRKRRVDLYRKDADGNWEISKFGAGDSMVLESIPCGALTISVDAIYDDVDFPGDKDIAPEVHEANAGYLSNKHEDFADWLDW